MTKERIKSELAVIVVKASARGNGRTVSLSEAAEMVESMIASDEAPEWQECRVGADQLRAVINGYLR